MLLKRILLWVGMILMLIVALGFLLAYKEKPEDITYGMSFNTLYAEELGLDVEEVYIAFLEDLGVRHLRLAAHWPMIEPSRGEFDFSKLDFQVREAEKYDADIILGVGRRLPRWPECHTPTWANALTWKEQKNEIREYITAVIDRYKDSPNIVYWQVENEPYLEVFAREHCGPLDENFLKEEIALVHTLDKTRPILVTDSGNIGTWVGAYRAGDIFGTSMYVYFWNPELGQFRTVLPAFSYRIKESIMRLFFGIKPTILIELSAEPWLVEPIIDVPIDIQLERMDIVKFEEILEYAEKSRYEKQYLWGGEWWFWLKQKGHPEMWERGSQLFK